MSNWTQLLLNESEKSDDPIVAKLTVEITNDWKINTSLEKWDKEPENMTEKELEESAKNVIKFFTEDLISRAVRWNIDLWAQENVLRYMIADWIKDCAKLLSMNDDTLKGLISDCKEKEKN